MATTNHERVGKALELLKGGLGPFVEREFQSAYKDRAIAQAAVSAVGRPSLYLAETADQHPGRLEAQSIPMDRDLWKVERFQDVLAARRQSLAAAVSELIAEPS